VTTPSPSGRTSAVLALGMLVTASCGSSSRGSTPATDAGVPATRDSATDAKTTHDAHDRPRDSGIDRGAVRADASDSSVRDSAADSSGGCPVTITIPSQNEAVGQYIQISVTQSCPAWTENMVAYIDQKDCSSTSYAYPNPGCHTSGGAQNFSTSTWVRVTPGTHTIVVDNASAAGKSSVSPAVTFSYAPADSGMQRADTGTTDPVFIAAGDIAQPNGSAAETGNLVRSLLSSNPGALVVTLGDNAYGSTNDDQGSANSYQTLYAPTWGSFVDVTLPVPGNHDYGNWDLGPTAACPACQDGTARIMSGYYAYFNGNAITVGGTTPTTFHYGYDFVTKDGETWRYVSLNSGYCFYDPTNCEQGSSEYEWFSTELSSHLKKSKGGTYAGVVVGTHFDLNESQECGGGNGMMEDFMQLMYTYKVDLYLAGHVHDYERFCALAAAPASTTQQNCGTRTGPVCDPAGPVEINVGTGGASKAVSTDPWAASQARFSVPGVIKVTLHDASWDFAFYNTSNAVLDSATDIATH
jgi:acid phosphatase type 7